MSSTGGIAPRADIYKRMENSLLNHTIGDLVLKMEEFEARSPKEELDNLRNNVKNEIDILKT
jgi:hypothetical protein